MTETKNPLKDRVLDRDDDLRDVLELLLQRANQRQMWLLFMDERGCLGDPLMPMHGYPDDPNAAVDIDDLGANDLDTDGRGAVTEAHVLMHRVGLLRQMTGNASVVLGWERTGSEVIVEEDRVWARAMAEAAQALDVPLRAQFIVHAHGVRQLHPDDYL